MPHRSIEEYQVGWLCALPKEMTAAQAMLDEKHEPFKTGDPLDSNNYLLGRVSNHNVVIACLPTGIYGTTPAATVANNMLRTFTKIRFGLMVGIGAGVPNLEKQIDIRLGDVVVSAPEADHGGVVQFDRGKNKGEGIFERTGFLKAPPTILLTALSRVQADHDFQGSQVSTILDSMIQQYQRLLQQSYGHPGAYQEHLYCSHHDSERRLNNDSCQRFHEG